MKVPKTRNNGTMTEAAFFGWIRSLLIRADQDGNINVLIVVIGF